MGDGLEVDRYLGSVLGQGLSGAQHERHARPALVGYGEGDPGEGLGFARRFYALLVRVGGDLPFPDAAGGVARARSVSSAEGRRTARRTSALRSRGSLPEAHGRLHVDQAQKLQEVVLGQYT